jgi:hypothetical protein
MCARIPPSRKVGLLLISHQEDDAMQRPDEWFFLQYCGSTPISRPFHVAIYEQRGGQNGSLCDGKIQYMSVRSDDVLLVA